MGYVTNFSNFKKEMSAQQSDHKTRGSIVVVLPLVYKLNFVSVLSVLDLFLVKNTSSSTKREGGTGTFVFFLFRIRLVELGEFN